MATTHDKYCEVCGKRIPKARLKALPNTTKCVKCSDTKAKVGIMVDGVELQMLDDNEYVRESLKLIGGRT